MAPNSLSTTWRSFWHTITSRDRHATPDSPFRTGQHVPLPQSRHATLTSVATNAVESTVNLNSSFAQDPDSATGFTQSSAPLSPPAPYSPGLRSSLSRQKTDDAQSAEIQMSNFQDGLPPPPPVSHSWKRIDRWAEDNYEELFENVCEGATQNDINELEHELDCTLPQDVRDSIQIHDGQERGGRPTGLIFGCMLLDCEEIVQEWNNWRVVNEEFLTASRPNNYSEPQAPLKAFAGVESSSSAQNAPQQGPNAFWRQQLLAKQDSQPPNAVQKAYAHPAWIPLARDWGGNNIAVDLAPGPTGKWGQIILMGRDYDCKYVISRSWATFLATLADDLSTDKWWVDEESKELKLREFKNQGVEPGYMDILRWRTDQKYGRRIPSGGSPGSKRKGPPPGGLHINANVRSASGNAGSPYSSPVSPGPERGRSPSRFALPGSAKNPSPKPNLSSPLARVTEETGTTASPLKLQTDSLRKGSATEKLVSVDTPRASGDFSKFAASLPNGRAAGSGEVAVLNKENLQAPMSGSTGDKVPEEATKTGLAEMKNVEI
ncbi:MAG: Cell wall assembly regulator [Bathelium mastoideum]|nr:MAG: Cell wall assembly regulator [Bathelium mastoideum]